MLEFIKCELVAVCDPVVANVDDQAAFLAAVQRAAQPAADHLLVDIRRERGARHVDGVRSRGIEALCENPVVREHPQVLAAEAVDVSPTDRWLRPVIDGCRGYSLEREQGSHGLGMPG